MSRLGRVRNMKHGIKLFFLFCLSSMMCISLLPSTIYAQEEDTQTVDEESSDSSELPKLSHRIWRLYIIFH